MAKKGVRRTPRREIRLRQAGRRTLELMMLFEVVDDILGSDVGVVLAPQAHFEDMLDVGVVTTVTDAGRALGGDGVGGFAFVADVSRTCFLMSVQGVKSAINIAAATRSSRGTPHRSDGRALSMPAAELFGAFAMAAAVADMMGQEPTAVISILDCDPAARALSALFSRSAQLRGVLKLEGGCSRDGWECKYRVS